MAGRGPAPKAERSRKSDNHVLEELEAGGLYGSPLPQGVLPGKEEWHPMTVQWWEAMRRNPLLANELEVGWQFLLDTALMHHAMWQRGKWEFAAELRLRVAKFGATPEDRMRLKIKVTPAQPADNRTPQADSANVSSIASRRARLTSA